MSSAGAPVRRGPTTRRAGPSARRKMVRVLRAWDAEVFWRTAAPVAGPGRRYQPHGFARARFNAGPNGRRREGRR
jgi:hypothetical protein